MTDSKTNFECFDKNLLKTDHSIFPLMTKSTFSFNVHGHFYGPRFLYKVKSTFYGPLRITDEGFQAVPHSRQA